jgi:butyrate kinase
MAYLAIDPGSTSTKVAVDWNCKFIAGHFDHPRERLDGFSRISDQKTFRYDLIMEWLEREGLLDLSFKAVIGRGGLIRPVPGGVYGVNAAMIRDLTQGVNGQHASNLGGLLAHEFSLKFNCPAFIADPVVVDEMEPMAKLTGLDGLERKSIFHALNQKAVARKVAGQLGRAYEELNLIVAHLGGGISVGAHRKGRVVDVNDALSGDGPYAPERTGSLPVSGIAQLIRSGIYTSDTLVKTASGKGGVVSYLGTSDIRAIEKKVREGDKKAELVLSGMIYQIAKEIGSLSAVLCGNIDAIVITGGLAHSKTITYGLMERIGFLAPVMIEPGEQELKALVDAARRVCENKETIKFYPA